jgi:hypothetical protein
VTHSKKLWEAWILVRLTVILIIF